MDENIILALIIALPIGVFIVFTIALTRQAKKKIRQQNADAKPKSEGTGDNRDLLELLAFYRQQYHQRQIPLEVFEAHEREIAAKLKEKREQQSQDA